MSTGSDTSAQPLEQLLLGALAGVVGVALVLDFSAALAGFVFADGWAWIDPGTMARVLGRLPRHLDDPRQAWPASIARELPGPAAMYLTAGVLIATPCAAAAAVWRRRSGAARDQSAATWARRRDLRPLVVSGPTPGRIPLGSAHASRLAVERHQSLLVVAPTQSGKTTALAIPAILDWAGPVIATSVKTDLVRDTILHRSADGHTLVFDPTDCTGLSSTASWTPLAQCRDWYGARRTAAWMTDAAAPSKRGLSDGDFWYSTAAKLLAPLLYAAATSGCTMEEVVRWIDRQESGAVMDALKYAGHPDAIDAMEATWARDDRQRSSVYTTAETVIEAYADPGVAAHAGRSDVDAEAFLDGGRNTLYLCASARNQRRLRPVFVTLLQELLEAAFARSSACGGPLDPPLLIVLDEAANIAPLPDLEVIAATCASHGIQLVTILQDLAQAHDRWGRERADTILNNHRALVFGAGISDSRTLETVGRLLGSEEVEQRSSTTGNGRETTTRSSSLRALAPPNLLRETQPGEALLIYGTLPPVRLALKPWFDDKRLQRLVGDNPRHKAL